MVISELESVRKQSGSQERVAGRPIPSAQAVGMGLPIQPFSGPRSPYVRAVKRDKSTGQRYRRRLRRLGSQLDLGCQRAMGRTSSLVPLQALASTPT
jgi:hypothetical protein